MFEGRIKQGVMFLDRKFGEGWVVAINLDNLNLHNCCNCVVGQLYGDFNSIYVQEDSPCTEDIKRMGFILETLEETSYGVLTQEWREKIEQLRKERAHAPTH